MSDSLLGVLPGTTGFVDPDAPNVAGSAGLAQGTGTGQHGIVPTPSDGANGMIGTAFTNLWNWLQTPFTQSMSPTDLFLLVGIIIVSIIMWNIILFHIRIAAETI